MSVLSEVYAVPSRVLGVYRYLLRAKGQGDSLEQLCRVLAPDSLPRRTDAEADGEDEGSGREMVRKTANECVRMGLLVDADGELRINPALPAAARDPETAAGALPAAIAHLLLAAGSPANDDFGFALAWYLTQDPLNPPGTWPEVDQALREQVGGDQLGMKTSNPYRMLEDWACYLGFTWTHSLGDKTVLTPDPTAHVRARLRELLPGKPKTAHPIAEVTSRLAQLCPVFEGGRFRNEVEQQWRPREHGHLSATTALAWLRLRDEGVVDFPYQSDAPTYSLPDGSRATVAVSHLRLLLAP